MNTGFSTTETTMSVLMMEVPWPNYFVGMIPLSVMPVSSRTPSNSSTLSQTTSRSWGAMESIITNGGKYEVSKRVTDLLHNLSISQ